MKEMCLPCYGTGHIRCLTCGGTGVMPNLGLLGEDCFKCLGTRKGHCQLCRGSGFIGGLRERMENTRVEWSLPLAA